jgi:hypothetical protein
LQPTGIGGEKAQGGQNELTDRVYSDRQQISLHAIFDRTNELRVFAALAAAKTGLG